MSDIEKWCQKDGVYRFDYIGQLVFEGKYYTGIHDHSGHYMEVMKTGCIYAFPCTAKVAKDGTISNGVSNRNDALRIRKFDNFYVIEPSGIIIPNNNVTFVSKDQKKLYERVCNHISPENDKEVLDICHKTFCCKYCQSISHESQVDKYDYEEISKLIWETTVRGEHQQEFNDACMFCYFLLENGINKVDLDVLKTYIRSLKNSLLDSSNYYKKCNKFIEQFVTLIYVGVLYSDYENIYKVLPRPKLDSYDPNTDEITSHIEETTGNQFSDLIIDDSEVVKKYLSEKYEKNKGEWQAMEYLANAYASFYERLKEETKQNTFKK